MTLQRYSGFWAGLFYRGILDGYSFWPPTSLSDKWAVFFRKMIEAHPESFMCELTGPLEGIELKVTSSGGAALVTISYLGAVAYTMLLMSGARVEAEEELKGIFVDSLRRTGVDFDDSTGKKPFEELFTMDQRPLLATAMWHLAQVKNFEVLTEITLHFAEAYFRVQFEGKSGV